MDIVVMDDTRKSEVKILIEKMGEGDLDYIHKSLSEAYKGEIDRKDKIISSMSVVSAPITILFAGVAFLTNSALDADQKYITRSPDVVVVLFYIIIIFLLIYVSKTLYNFHKLLSGEDYFYLPDADGILDNMAKNKAYCMDNNVTDDGEASRYSKADIILQLSESATRNCAANDVRLRYRQRIFRSTILAIICAALGFLVVAVHREQPNVWNVSDLWRQADARLTPAAPTTQQPSTSAQTPPGTKQPNAAPTSPVPPSGH